MSVKAIDFETLQELCKHGDETECSEEDNFSCVCDRAECPVWNDLINSELEL